MDGIMKDSISIEDLIPHRGKMMLVEEVIYSDSKSAITAATVNDRWPTFRDGSINPLVCIELVAQTAGVSVGLDELTREGKKQAGKGWIVGIKKASFSIDEIPVGSRIITEVREMSSSGAYSEVDGRSLVGDTVVLRVVLQAVRADMDLSFIMGGTISNSG